MPTTELITPPRSPRPATSRRPSLVEAVGEIGPLVDIVPFNGPPLIFLIGPWLFLGLMLAAPFAVLVTFVVLMAVSTALVALLLAVLASPFVLVRHVRAQRAVRRPAGARAMRTPSRAPVAPVREAWGTD